MCDVVYVMQLERLERQVLADRQVAATFIAAGSEDLELPNVDAVRDQFDAALVAPPERDASPARLLRELGVVA